MRIAIVGAGVVGVTTAYELGVDGHEVTVFERHSAAAEESSFAHCGLIAPGHTAPWSVPRLLPLLLRQWLDLHAGLRLRSLPGWRELSWLAAARRGTAPESWRRNRARMQRLATYSRWRLHELTERLQLQYDCSPGLLVLLRDERSRRRIAATLPLLQESEVRYEELTPQGARAIEPGLDPAQRLAGALHLPDEGVANGRQFVQLLRRKAEAQGVRFEFGRSVLPLDPGAPSTLRLGAGASAPFDAIVVCAGAASAALLQPLGLRMPLAAVYGYSVTAAIGEAASAPRSGVFDERHGVAITRLGERVRVCGGAELGGSHERRDPAALRTLYKVLGEWFPGAARLSGNCVTVQEWRGARPTLPDGPPVIGASGIPGVWLNLGHGGYGWAMACGSARATADLIAGRQPELDLEGLGVTRLLG
ncbi:FAD-dependent oxidoreductase [Ramlibacter sp. AW1]|uniref:FAD-dependent oxidoreductase n=1 Tax=Ramlibacter aurantiacus TaxID=2801330 RepID=A0A937D1B9_9BURK|nr:FAD-dependent oxidoreductase [Ramlibacter aurantiacus]MBL0420364.1 FAD-dependent oxidoreductase [Ramlibacter aurantiacus]